SLKTARIELALCYRVTITSYRDRKLRQPFGRRPVLRPLVEGGPCLPAGPASKRPTQGAIPSRRRGPCRSEDTTGQPAGGAQGQVEGLSLDTHQRPMAGRVQVAAR